VIPLPDFTISCWPIVSEKRRIWWLTALCVTPRSSAASFTERWRETASK
jgi:hypothetical protein